MSKQVFSDKVKIKIFDKQFKGSTSVYGLYRFKEVEKHAEILQNHQAIQNALGVTKLLLLNQVHEATVVDADDCGIEEPRADGIVTTIKGVALGIQTADCVPVLLACEDGGVIGGAHCGWRSAVANIIENIVELMHKKGANSIKAWVGPAIHQSTYEVDEHFRDIVLKQHPTSKTFFIPAHKLGHHMFDLPGFVIQKLEEVGVKDIFNINENTYTIADKYYSNRRVPEEVQVQKRTNLSTIVITD